MKLEIRRNQDAADISLEGSMHAQDSASIEKQLVALVEEGVSTLTLDCSKLDFIDSSGLGMLIFIHKRCHRRRGALIDGLRYGDCGSLRGSGERGRYDG
jgi:anti-sigma B factor antagonist